MLPLVHEKPRKMDIVQRLLRRLSRLTVKELCLSIICITGLIVLVVLARDRISPVVRYVEYDLSSASTDVFTCPELALPPIVDVKVCLHPEEDDKDVTPKVRYEGCYRRAETALFYNAVRREPDYGLIDVGAGLGQDTLIAASQGRPVLAVEPLPENVFRLQKSLQDGLPASVSRVRLLMNAVGAEARLKVQMTWPKGRVMFAHALPEEKKCLSADRCAETHLITLDDLLPYVGFPAAFLKVSTSGSEAFVFSRAKKLFARIRIPLVFMDFGRGHDLCAKAANGSLPVDDPEVVALGDAIHFLFDREYLPHHGGTGEQLEGTRCQTWPKTVVIWEHLTFKGAYT